MSFSYKCGSRVKNYQYDTEKQTQRCTKSTLHRLRRVSCKFKLTHKNQPVIARNEATST